MRWGSLKRLVEKCSVRIDQEHIVPVLKIRCVIPDVFRMSSLAANREELLLLATIAP